MKRVKELILTRAGFSIVSNIITIFAALLLFRPFWEEGDDVGMALLVEGAYGYHESHILYSNTIYGKILCALQSIIPLVRWHSVLMYAFAFVSLTIFVYILSKDKKGRILSVILLISVFYETYVAFQFSKVAAVIAISSYMVLFDVVRKNHETAIRKRLAILAIICLTYSVILRYESFILATLIAGIFGVCTVLWEIKSGEFASRIRSYCALFIPVFVIFAVCFGINSYSYSSDGWKDYADYFASVEQIADYHPKALLYDIYGDDLAALGVSENDAYMLITYQGSDPQFLTADLMENISALDKKGLSSIDGDFVKAWIANINTDLLDLDNASFAGLIFIIGMIAFFAVVGKDKIYVLANSVIQSILAFVILFYYQYSERWSHRIVYALILAQLIMFVYMLSRMEKFELNGTLATCMLIILAVCTIGSRLENEFSYREYERSTYEYAGFIEYMRQNRDTLFVGDVFTMNDYGRYDIFTPSTKDQYANYLSTDSVYLMNTPVNRSIATAFGYTDPFEALRSRNEKVILADSVSPEVELRYCNEHGDGKEYALEELDPVGNIRLYRIR